MHIPSIWLSPPRVNHPSPSPVALIWSPTHEYTDHHYAHTSECSGPAAFLFVFAFGGNPTAADSPDANPANLFQPGLPSLLCRPCLIVVAFFQAGSARSLCPLCTSCSPSGAVVFQMVVLFCFVSNLVFLSSCSGPVGCQAPKSKLILCCRTGWHGAAGRFFESPQPHCGVSVQRVSIWFRRIGLPCATTPTVLADRGSPPLTGIPALPATGHWYSAGKRTPLPPFTQQQAQCRGTAAGSPATGRR